LERVVRPNAHEAVARRNATIGQVAHWRLETVVGDPTVRALSGLIVVDTMFR
jgi:hypothetical protein